jgi:replicative DNA helicase
MRPPGLKGLTREEAEAIVLAGREFRDLPLRLGNASSLSVAEIAARVRAEKTAWSRRNRSLDLVVIDYLKLIKPGGAYSGQRHYEVGEITRGLKVLAKDLNVCVLLLAQINRGPEARENKRPLLSDLRESGDLEADADVVLLLYRDAYYLAQDPNVATDLALAERYRKAEHVLEINVAKNRQGSIQVIEAYCNPAAGIVRNAARADGRGAT